MEIYINGRFLTQQMSGVQAFAREITRELAAEYPVKLLVPKNSELTGDDFGHLVTRTGIFTGHAWEQFSLPFFMKKHPGALLINLCNSAPLFLSNQAVTIHDLAFLNHPEWFHPAFSSYYRFMVPRIVKNSSIILTVSACIKNELSGTLHVDENKIVVIPNKVSASLLEINPVPPAGNFHEKKFFLMVGSNDPRKNFVLAEKLFSDRFSDLQLVIAGGSNRNFRKRKISIAENILHPGYVTNAELKWLYLNAAAFINPSLYEGFGIPNLEAMAFECPVICSDIPVFRETCGEAALYFNPLSRDELAGCIDQIVSGKINVSSKTSIGKGIFTKFQDIKRPRLVLKFLQK